jgi:hypothetical protein
MTRDNDDVTTLERAINIHHTGHAENRHNQESRGNKQEEKRENEDELAS